MEPHFILSSNTNALDLDAGSLVKHGKQPPRNSHLKQTKSTIDISDLLPDTSPPTILLPIGKFISRKSPQRTKEEFDVLEIQENFENTSVTVAVRVRPFLDFETERKYTCIVTMKENETIIGQRGTNSSLQFCYDYSFWSFDRLNSQYSSQKDVYEKLGQPLLVKSLEGFNICLLAYGQTGSGKSYSITGSREDPGIVPRFCDELFARIGKLQENYEDPTNYKVEISFYEIYNEHIYDLLASQKTRKERNQLRVREHPVLGPYVEDLSTYVATSYKDVEHWLTLGNRFRATACTGMNDRSSRSHSCFMLVLTQNREFEGEECNKVSKINLVDLAGSERVKTSLTSSDRLREGQNINRSLHTLSKVISLLSDNEISKKKHFIPYRESVLTWLLKESLGGNSKTTMLATISPSHVSASETLSTLRYAQQARNIVNVAKVNEDPKNRLIRELQAEITRLKTITLGGKSPGSSQQEIQLLRDQLFQKERLMADATRTWIDRLKMTERRKLEEIDELRKSGISLHVENTLPNLVNLNEDPQLSEMLIYILKEGSSTVGRKGSNSDYDIKLTGALVSEKHCTFINDRSLVTLNPIKDAPTYVNGNLITETQIMHHGDRIIIGGDHFFRLNNPVEVNERPCNPDSHTNEIQGFAYARKELYEKQAARIETELTEARQEEREKMMQKLRCMQSAANDELINQRQQYELQLIDLSKKTDKYKEEHETFKEAQGKLGDLEERIRLLEDENMAQRHLIQLGEFRKRKENEDMKKYHTRLIHQLEQEKKKLEEEINQAREAHEKRKSVEFLPQISGSELVRISMMLQEANAIALQSGKMIIFTREDIQNTERDYSDSTPKINIRLYDKENKTTTLWELEKFENQLMQMRELYHAELDSTSIKMSHIFNHPNDQWNKDLGLYTPRHIHTKFKNTTDPCDKFEYSSDMGRLPTLPATIPESLVTVLTSSTGELHSPVEVESPILTNYIPDYSNISKDLNGPNFISHVTSKEQLFGITTHLNFLQEDKEILTPPRISISPDLINSAPTVPELCLERVDRLLLDLKNNRTITSLEKFLDHAECLLCSAEEFVQYFPTKPESLFIPLAESDGLRNAAINMSTSFEMLATYGIASCHFILHSSQCDTIERGLVNIGLSVKRMLFSTQPDTRVDVKNVLIELIDQLDYLIRMISHALLSKLVHTQTNSKKTSRLSKLSFGHEALDLDFQAHKFFSHHSKLSNCICRGVLAYVREVSLHTVQKIRSCHEQVQDIFQLLCDDSNFNSVVLEAICKVIVNLLNFFAAFSHIVEIIEGPSNDILPLFKEVWSKLVWILSTLICIESCVIRLVVNTKESVEGSGELEKIVSQANVIAFHTMSATSSLDELKQRGFNLVPGFVELEPLSKDVIRAAKALNNLAKRCSVFSTTYSQNSQVPSALYSSN